MSGDHQSKRSKLKKKKNSRNRNDGFMETVNAFKTHIPNGSYYICIVGNRCLYKSSVFRFSSQ